MSEELASRSCEPCNAETPPIEGENARRLLGEIDPRWEIVDEHHLAARFKFDDFLGALFLAALLYAPVLMMFWFAPPLAAWHGTGPAKALFFSFFACLLNWRPFLAYGAVSAFFALALPLAVLFVLMMASFKVAAMSLVFPLLLVLLPTLFASFYASYHDIFGVEPQ